MIPRLVDFNVLGSQPNWPFIALTKPRIIELLLITTVPTMVLAEQGWPDWNLILATFVGGALAAGGANTVNMYIDRDIDAKMERTRERPLVTGVIEPLLTGSDPLRAVMLLERLRDGDVLLVGGVDGAPAGVVEIAGRRGRVTPSGRIKLGVGFVPVRKPGKLPAATFRAEYDLEYGSDAGQSGGFAGTHVCLNLITSPKNLICQIVTASGAQQLHQ